MSADAAPSSTGNVEPGSTRTTSSSPATSGRRRRRSSTMLATIGVASLDELIDQAVPASIRFAGALDLPGPVSERDVIAELRQLAGQNRVLTSLIGMGYTNTIMPPVIARNVFENPAWYTAYTPYQPEISQGRLEALLNFQTMISELTGLEIANASLLDEATAAAEAMTMARRLGAWCRRPLLRPPRHAPADDRGAGDTGRAGRHRARRRRRRRARRRRVVRCPLQLPDVDRRGHRLDGGDRDGPRRRWPGDRRHRPAGLRARRRHPGQIGADIVVGSAQRFGVPMGVRRAARRFHRRRCRAPPGRFPAVSSG